MNKVTIKTTTVVNDTRRIEAVMSSHLGQLTEYDTARARIASKPPVDFEGKLRQRMKIDLDLNYSDGELTIYGMDLAKEDLDSALSYYLNEKVDVSLVKRNFNIRSVGPSLGDTFRQQGEWALAISFVLMSIVIFVAFRQIIPSLAVIQAAICDVVIAVGAMSLFGIPIEPSTIGALLMLIGYSIDTDIMLSSRTLKDRRGDFEEQVIDAIKTGLTMTGTTIAALTVVYFVSTYLTHIETWENISFVLIFGLLADIPATYLTNAGIIRWYIESGGAKGRLRWRK